MTCAPGPRRSAQRGAALLIAMALMTLVATLASGMIWQQYRAIQVEAAERSRTQSAWILSGALDWARLILRDLINATIGFEQLARLTAKPSKSLHRMLSPAGNPSMDNLAAIFHAIRERLNVNLEAHSVAA